MQFSSLTFLFIFFPAVLILYYLIPSRNYRNLILLIASLAFYAWGEPVYIYLIVVEILINYGLVRLMASAKSPAFEKSVFALIIVIDISILGFYKYSNFLISIVNDAFNANLEMLKLALPIGISFFTFQVLSYVIGVYTKKVKVQKSLFLLATYVAMFPQLLSGPIIRYETIEDQLMNRKETLDKLANGLRRFLIGLGKKIILADNIVIVADLVFRKTELVDYTSMLAWLGAIAYALQIYFDFSGYSDMAIGVAKIFGFDFPENFNYPYIATSITDFWRRWHISLSTWFRDYVYIPLGGNRVKTLRWLLNIMIVWMLTGLWHGASFIFIAWGLYFGILLIVEKLFLLKILEKLPILRNIYTLVVVIFGFVIFNSSSLAQVAAFATQMFTRLPHFDFSVFESNNIAYLIPYLGLGMVASTPIFKKLFDFLNKYSITGLLYDFYLLAVFLLCIMFLINSSYTPFIYFQF